MESLVDSARDPSMENEESDQGIENQNRQEDSITVEIPNSMMIKNPFKLNQVRRSDDETRDRGSTSSASDQNRSSQMPHLGPSVPPPHQQDLSVQNHPSFGLPQPMMQQNQFRIQAPVRPMLPQDQFVVYIGQVPVRPMMYYQEQDQIVPNVGIGQQAPVRPPATYNQDQIVPNVGLGQQAPMRPPVTYNQDQIVPSLGQLETPMWQPPVRPMMNYNQQQQFNQRFRFPVNMIQHQPSPNAAAAAPRPEVNQQLQPPAQQQPRRSQGSNADEPSSSGQRQG
ncbi:hypothetical protein Rs2_07306 [Raphanus sativus]|nr:hypothetical protein Rs2_07306 [Raphanus sativus]